MDELPEDAMAMWLMPVDEAVYETPELVVFPPPLKTLLTAVFTWLYALFAALLTVVATFLTVLTTLLAVFFTAVATLLTVFFTEVTAFLAALFTLFHTLFKLWPLGSMKFTGSFWT